MKETVRLGVNIDHVATVRQARKTVYPSPLDAALISESAGADGITLHLREDRRHIQEDDVRLIHMHGKTPLNLEMAMTDEMVQFALELCPKNICLVPERREELTTEGGLDVVRFFERTKQVVQALKDAGMSVSLFIEPDEEQLSAAYEAGAPVVELHTGRYAEMPEGSSEQSACLEAIRKASLIAASKGLIVNAGHGLHLTNTAAIASIPEMNELNIGHSLIARALFVGLAQAVSEMKAVIMQARST